MPVGSRRCTGYIENTEYKRVVSCNVLYESKAAGRKIENRERQTLGEILLSESARDLISDWYLDKRLSVRFKNGIGGMHYAGGSGWWWKVVVFSLWKSWYFFVLFATENKVFKHFALNVILYVLFCCWHYLKIPSPVFWYEDVVVVFFYSFIYW